MTRAFFSFFTLVFFGHLNTQAQDTLIFLNGKHEVVNVSHETASFVVYQKFKKNGSLSKMKDVAKEDLFSIQYFLPANADSAQKVSQIYQVDSILEDYFTVAEMNRFLDGRNEARENYKAFKFTAGGFLVGLGAGYLGAYWGLVPCGVYTGASASWNFPIWFKVSDDETKLKDDHFLAGYKEQSRKKQARNAALGSLTGLITSVTSLYFLISAQQ